MKGKFCLLLCLISLLVVGVAGAQDTTPEATPAPEVPRLRLMLKEFDPWRMVLGSDSPTFAAYDNGLIIFKRVNDNGDAEFVSVQLSPERLDSLLADFGLSDAFYKLDKDYETVGKTDQPSSVITVFDEQGIRKQVSVYGDLRQDEEARRNAPAAYLKLYDSIDQYHPAEAKTWLPEQFEVVVWLYDNAGDSVNWPKEWPGLDDASTVKRDDVYSLYLDMDQYERFQKLTKDASALKIDGKTWAFMVRFPFPHEHQVSASK
jgi:hypothetical protein